MKKEQASYDFSRNEQLIQSLWEDGRFFEKLVEKNKNGSRFRFLDGPITANNAMGVHHAFGRTLKDITIKYNSMKGRSCQFQNGFDAQGLWVEVEVEKQLGFKSKTDIIEYGLDKFTDACMDRVQEKAGVITEQSKRLGQWMDWDHSYFTNTDENITSIWHFLKVCHERGWLVRRKKVMPWCPRCGTSLSEHEMTGAYSEVTCESVFIRLPIRDENASILVWTTTPWTLTSNVAVAVNPDMEYVYCKVKSTDRLLIVCKEAAKRVIKGDMVEIVKTVKGSELVGKEYETVFPELPVQNFIHKIIPWEDVVATEGTGAVHIAPGCGAEDYELGLKYDLPKINPINESGIILPEFAPFDGKSTVEVAHDVFDALKASDKLYYIQDYTHSYAHCWRCKTDIVFRLVDEWYLASDEIRPQLIEAIDHVEWQPEHLKKRMLDWLNNMGDWNISRKRFYGLPLPFYVCPKCGKVTVIGSKEELVERSSPEEAAKVKNLHRPWIDEVKIRCDCGELVSRISEVGDCWLDAGITPFSTKKYFTDREYWKNNFPSDVVIEMVEQIRLWFYSLLFMSVTLEGVAPYKKVVSYGSVVQENGSRFSKSGTMIRLEDVCDKLGADTIRYMYAGNNSINDLRFGYGLGDEARRKILGFWNSYVFFNTYASIDNPELAGFTPDESELTVTDKWLIQVTNDFIREAAAAYESHMYQKVLKAFELYIDNMSNWYIRINRRRFYKDDGDKRIAYWTLYQALKTTIRIMAPIMPFITDYIWQNMVREIEPAETESVHLSDFPESIWSSDYSEIVSQTEKIRDIIYLAQKLRNEHKIAVKQPLRAMFVKAEPDYAAAINTFESFIKDETNVQRIEFVANDAGFFETKLTVNFKAAGAILKKEVNRLKQTVSELSESEVMAVIAQFDANGEAMINGFDMPLTKDVFNVVTVPKAEYAVVSIGNNIVALDLEIDNELRLGGMLRKLIRQLQLCRKDANYSVEDRIHLEITSDDEDINGIVNSHRDKLASELLACEIGKLDSFDYQTEIEIDSAKATVRMLKA